MTVSNFPRRIPIFPNHRDLLDTVEAAHLNNVQNELTAVMESLGVNPQIFNDVVVPSQDTSGIVIDEGGVVTDDALQYSSIVYRYYDPQIAPVDHGNVGARLDDIERGKQNHAFKLLANNFNIQNWSTSSSVKPLGIRMGSPRGTQRDPYGYWNGYGASIRKSGFWILMGSIGISLQTTDGSSDGVYLGAIDFDGNYFEGMDKQKIQGTSIHPVLNPFLMGWFNAGTHIVLRVAQNSGRTQKVTFSRLSGVLLREDTT